MAKDYNLQRVKAPESNMTERLVGVQRVAKVVKGGRRFSFSAIVVVGNMDGTIGFGLGKAAEVQAAIAKAVEDAKKNLIKVPVHHGTVPHEIFFKYGAAKVLIKPAAPGSGVLAGGAMRAVLECAGLQNVLGKSLGSSNPHNVVKATAYALANMRDAGMVAKQRGISINKVFHGE
jgi:small subunit ribosomal protein S5